MHHLKKATDAASQTDRDACYHLLTHLHFLFSLVSVEMTHCLAQLLRDNLTLWTSDTTGEGEDGGDAGEQA